MVLAPSECHAGRRKARPNVEVADVFRAFGPAYRRNHVLTAEQRKVIADIIACRTSAMGGHIEVCDRCGHRDQSYNSCLNRHCPKCQSLKQAQWLEQRKLRILPTNYFHVVFTLPEQLRPLAIRNRKFMYGLLFKAASQTLKDLAKDKKMLGAEPGFTAVLHTWSRELAFHPHLHVIATGGGLSQDGSRWLPANPDYLFPVEVLSRLFRGKFLAEVVEAYQNGKLNLTGSCKELKDPQIFRGLRRKLYRMEWNVFVQKNPVDDSATISPEKVFKYLGRYTQRVAISNQRIVSIDDETVTFRTKNANTITLTGEEFLRRFLMHVLPKRFVKIRHYGLMAGCNVKTKLETARFLLQPDAPQTTEPEKLNWKEWMLKLTGIDPTLCPRCKKGTMRRSVRLPRSTFRSPLLHPDSS